MAFDAAMHYGRRNISPDFWRDVDDGLRVAPTHLGVSRLAFFACGAWEGYWDSLPRHVRCEGCHAAQALTLRMSNV